MKEGTYYLLVHENFAVSDEYWGIYDHNGQPMEFTDKRDITEDVLQEARDESGFHEVKVMKVTHKIVGGA